MMRLRTALVIGLAFIAFAAGVPQAQAAIVSITYTGINPYGEDDSGLFGPPGGSLEDATVSETFVYDTSKGFYTTGGGSAQVIYGILETPGYTQTLVGVSLTVNGNSFNLPVNNAITATYNEADASGFRRLYTGYYFNDGSTATELGSVFWNQTVPDNLAQPYYSDQPGSGLPVSGGSNVSIIINDNYTSTISTETWLQFVPATVQISSVPEPSSWASMLLGMGLLGIAMRRSRPLMSRI